jgi:hypothetical protein
MKKLQYTTNQPSATTDYLAADNTWKTIPGGGGGVPYTGATANVDLGEYGLDAGFVSFDTTPTGTPTTQGTMSWDVDHNTVQLVMNGTTGRILEDVFYIAKNQTGSTIPKGTVVRADGTLGASGRIKIAPFLADGTYPSEYLMGVTAEAIANGDDGMVVHFGQIRNVNTSAYSNGDILYASPSSAGAFTTTPPNAPNNIVQVAIVIHAASNGTLQVRPSIGINGAASTIKSLNLTASRALVSDGSGKVAVSAVTDTELGYLSGVTSSIQTQLNSKIGASSQVLTFQIASTINASATTYLNTGVTTTTIENAATMIAPVAFTLSNMYTVHYTATQPASGAQVLTVRKNGVDTALSITIAAGSAPTTTPYSDLTNSVSFAVGDRMTIKRQNLATAAGGAVSGISLKLTI